MANVKRRIWVASLLLAWSAVAVAQERFIVMASTTSTEQSGLFAHLLPAFKAKSGIEERVVAQGTGQALATARKGDADVVFVHDRVAEQKFVDEGFGLDRREVMYNDFVIVGPEVPLSLGLVAVAHGHLGYPEGAALHSGQEPVEGGGGIQGGLLGSGRPGVGEPRQGRKIETNRTGHTRRLVTSATGSAARDLEKRQSGQSVDAHS